MRYFLSFIVLLLTLTSCDAQSAKEVEAKNVVLDTTKVLQPKPYYSRIEELVAKIFSRYHYRPVKLNDSLSSIIYNNFIKSIDYNKMYFLKSDIEKFAPLRTKLDDDLKAGIVNPPYEIFNVYKKRINSRTKFVLNRLQKGFDFDIDEYYVPDRKDSQWVADSTKLDDLWRKRLKYEALNLKLAGKKWDKVVEILSKRYKNYQKAILQYKAGDVFELFLNSFAESVDPHSTYFSPRDSENFDIRMKLSLEGIGAQLRTDNDYTKVVKIIPGGPAYKSDLLHADDRIVAVGQGEKGDLVDVIGWRIDDVVQLIRGKKGTVVRLAILKAEEGTDALPDTISLVRDKVKLEGQAAKKEVIEIDEENHRFKLGVIKIPSFYIDFDAKRKGDKNYRSTTRDVYRLLQELKQEKVDGIIIDLRNNGGGSLEEAISLTGLFIKKGPIVQVRNSNGSIQEDDDPDSSIIYKGALGVLVNRFSASASEIFSAAIQDYGRGLIIGEQTYGKGTVQNLINLDRFLPISGAKAGELKLTIAKFYRITGSSTQNLGVIPDVKMPSSIDPSEYGESANPSALKWDKISPAKYQKYGDLTPYLPELIKLHNERIKSEPEFQYIFEDIAQYKERKKKKRYSLLESVRKKEKEKNEAKRKAREEARKKFTKLKVIEKGETKTKDLKIDDPRLEESGHIISDLILEIRK